MKKTKNGFSYKDRKYQKTNVDYNFNFYQEEITTSLLAEYEDNFSTDEVNRLQKDFKAKKIDEDEYNKRVAKIHTSQAKALYNTGMMPRLLAVMYFPEEDEIFNPNKPDFYGESYEDRIEFFKMMPTKNRQQLEVDVPDFFMNAAESIAATSQNYSASKKGTKQDGKPSKKKG